MELIKMDVMKKYTIIAAMAAALLSIGCAKEQTLPDEGTVLKASLSTLTKTSIEGVKVSWSEGDIIKVNGTNSSALAEAAATAEFEFRTALTSPYKALYPVSIYKDAETVTLPALVDLSKQQIVPLAGYAETGNEIAFQALTAFLKVSLTGETSKTLKDITLKSLGGEQVSGDFTLAYPALTLSGASAAEADQQVKVTVNMALSATPLVVYIPIPAGTYASGYQVDFLDADGKVMRQAVSARTIKAGELREMPALVFEPNVADDPNIGGIPDAKELSDFAAAVNEGRSISRWINNSTGAVELLADIDCSSITGWQPIGACTMTAWTHVNLTVSGNPFVGTFDGKNHVIKNLKMSFNTSGSWGAYGFFGCIGDNSVVKNITFDESCSMTITAAFGGAFGMLAGLVQGATIDNITNKATINGGATDALANGANGRCTIGGIVGEVHPSEASASLSKLHNYGQVGAAEAIFDARNNKQTGANAVQIGGIAGFSTNTNNETSVGFTDCINDGDIYSNAGRASGIVAASNRYTLLKNCTNNGNQTNSFSGNCRLANITCIAGVGSALENVCNKGNLIAPAAASAAGVLCLVNDDTVSLTDCSSIGATIVCTGFDIENNKTTYAGALYGQCNKNNAVFSGCSVSGKVGKSVDNLLTLTADNYFPFVGEAYTNNASISKTNIKFAE